MDNFNHIETRKLFDELCGFKNYYVCYRHGTKRPLHEFKNKEVGKEFTKKEILRSQSFGVRCGLDNNLVCIDCDFKKDKNASDLPEEWRNTYTDDTEGGKHYFFLLPNGIPDYWSWGTKKTKYKFDLMINPNVAVAMTNSFGCNDKYYVNIKYMPPQVMPKDLFNLIDEEQKLNHVDKNNNTKTKIDQSNNNIVIEKSNIDITELENIIMFCPASFFNDFISWCKMGWIIHFETDGSLEGLELFIKASRQVAKYSNTDRKVYEEQWYGSNVNNKSQLTIASVYKMLSDEGLKYICKTHKEFNREYFHNLTYNKDVDKIEAKKEEKEELNKKKEEIEDNLELNAKAKKSKLNKVKRAIKKVEEDLRDMYSEKKQMEYKYKKEYFELFHFKLRSPHAYCIIGYEELIFYNKSNMLNYYENLYLTGKNEFVKEWIKDKYVRTYKNMDFLPYGLPCPNYTYNMFKGFDIERNGSVEIDIESIDIILNHMKKLTGDDEKCYNYFLDYLSHMVQKPFEKPKVAVVFRSKAEGVGKNVFLERLYNNMLGRNYGMSTANQDDILRQFNTSDQKFIIIMDEAQGKDSFINSEKIKSRITNDDIYKEEKGFKGFMLKDFARLFFLSNNETPIKIGLTDRRFVVYECCCEQANDIKYFKPLVEALEDKNVMKTLFEFLKKRDISKWDSIADRPVTEAYKDMQSVNVPMIAKFLCWFVDNQKLGYKINNEDYSKCAINATKFYEECIDWKTTSGWNTPFTATAFGRQIKQYEGIKKFRNTLGITYSVDLNKLRSYLKEKGYYEKLPDFPKGYQKEVKFLMSDSDDEYENEIM